MKRHTLTLFASVIGCLLKKGTAWVTVPVEETLGNLLATKQRRLPLVILTTLLLLPGCSNRTKAPNRYCWVTGLNPEKAEYYEQLHADPWPGVSKKIRECNIRNYSIHKREIDGKLYLFSYLEYIGDDFEADMKKMAADPETQRWWKETDPCQLPLPDAAAEGNMWSDTQEVFYLE